MPSALGLLGLLLAATTIWLDRTYSGLIPFVQDLGPVTTRSVLQTIATATITIISLTYSITLVVFTLAAGNIGPRLLTRFRESTLTRFSIGVFCCTFLFTISTLSFVGDDYTPRLSAFVAFLLGIITVYVLILYVQHVSSQVLVDNEVAEVSAEMHAAVEGFLDERDRQQDREPPPLPAEPPTTVHATKTGYVRRLEVESMVDAARKHDCFIFLKVAPGDFLIEGLPVALVHGRGAPEVRECIARDGVIVGRSRSPDADVSFLIHLLNEIALRALSPGVNDSYTAITCIDNLSATLAELLRHKPPSKIHCDSDGNPRLYSETLNIKTVMDNTLRPLRVSARGNILVTRSLLRALNNANELCLPEYHHLVRFHIRLIIEDAKKYISQRDDLDYIMLGVAAPSKEEQLAT
ncbi:DUF2254 domain-containing protein [Rhodomicrobium sp. Az07]|nr:DUF2254 domain-containing protein [Rhodomicrobium sp. Az07]